VGIAANFNAGGRHPIPTQSIETWQRLILKESGAQVTDIIFTRMPFQKFLNAEGVQGAIYYPKFGDSGNVINSGSQIEHGAAFKGMWDHYRLWIYNDWFVDDNDVEPR
jgi:hypothetical protein